MCSEPNHDHSVDWAQQNELRKQWLLDNPDATYGGWMSI